MESGNYINIQGWMVTELKLKGNDLIIYALIYGFSQDKKSMFNGSYDYIKQWINVGRRAAIDIIERLVKKGLVIKIVNENYGNSYKAIRQNISEDSAPVQQSSEESSQSSEDSAPLSSEDSSPSNNKRVININNNDASAKIEFEPYKKYTQETFKFAIFEANKKLSKPLINGELKKFYDYWSEPNQRGVMRFQLQQTWETGRRLATWRDRAVKPEHGSARNVLN